MGSVDIIVIFIYFVGVLSIGGFLSTKIKNSRDMFIAGRNSTWWIAGLSTYMTLFSAGTFVVWAGVAYRYGLVAVIIGNLLGVGSLITGWMVSGKWRQLGISSPAEYLGIRFGKSVINFYTLIGLIGRSVSTAVALYAISVMLVALIPLPADHMLADTNTGNLSVYYVIFLLGFFGVVYTIAGGFLAVLITDLIQFAVLLAIILFLVPLSLQSVGGVNEFVQGAPEGFFSLVSKEYTFIWLILWGVLNFFMISGDWPFVQRYISVPSVRDAKKAAFMVAACYLITPIIWYIPAMVYRVMEPGANPEQAYILVSQHVLPQGILGIMIAAMISATMSMVDSTLNVFAGVFTYDIYKKNREAASEKRLILVGRIFTAVFGILIIVFALLIPILGGAERVIVSFITMVIGPLAIPAVWGLFSKHIGKKAIWFSMGITYTSGFIVKLIIEGTSFINGWVGHGITNYVQSNVALVEASVGLLVPVTILIIMEIISRRHGIYFGWTALIKAIAEEDSVKVATDSSFARFAVKVLLWTFVGIGLFIGILALFQDDQRITMLLFSLAFLLAPGIFLVKGFFKRKK